ncbi:restriction endonuclease subunit S [Campylobacter concisus]|uniref:restriction endonuclease subunit S n=1 Tax=Campylobacter concisus TaxID=199 RepID=UPI00122C9D38|nr:restriction endonuclease subunit S [Campylobacter concisus]
MSEFKNLPSGWKVVRLGEICNVKQGLQIPISERFCENAQNRYFYITNEFLKEKSEVKYYIENPPESTICFCDDILMTRTGNTGMVVTNVFGVFHNNFFKIAYDRQLIKKEYFVFCLTGSKIQSEILKRAGSSTIPDLNHSDFLSIKIPLPPLDEQKKIAEILSTWDEAINLTINLIESKKQFKKALMQNLLTAKIRFPEFKNEWKEIKLGNIGKSYNGLIGKVAEDFQNGNSNFITYKNIFDNPKIDINIFEKVKIMEDEEQNLVKFGDIFFTTSSETPNEVGISSVLLIKCGILYLNSFCFGFRLNNFEILSPYFAVFYFRSDCFRKQTFKLAQGSTRFNISKTEVLNLNIKIPNLSEQQKIADVLTACDDEINLLNLKLENLKKQKQGLMQKLLSGKVRI